MKFKNAVIIIFTLFFASILLQLLMIAIAYLIGKLYINEVADLLISTIKIYSIHVSILFAGSFFKQIEERTLPVNKTVLAISIVLSGTWNLILVASTFIAIYVSNENYYKLVEFQGKVSEASAFLITGVLSYFFVSKPDPKLPASEKSSAKGKMVKT